MRFVHPLQQKGAALIMVLGIVAMITVLITQLISQVNAGINQSSRLKDMRQAYWYGRAGETFALSKLNNLASKQKLEPKDLSWTFPLDDGQISYQLTSMHDCMNLNSLTKSNKQDENSRYLNKVWKWFLIQEKGLDVASQEKLMHRVKDWIDKDSIPTLGYGAEAPFYSGQTIPQQPSNQSLQTTEPLQQMELVPIEKLPHLLAQLCSRPGDYELSLNPQDLTAEHVGILASIFQGQLDKEQLYTLFEQRPEDGYQNVDQFWQQPTLKELNISPSIKKHFSLKRHYFELQTQIQFSESQFGMNSLLYINSDNQKRVIARRYGVMP